MPVHLLDINLAFLAKGTFFSSRISPGVNFELMWLPCELPFKWTVSFFQATKAHQIFTINKASVRDMLFVLRKLPTADSQNHGTACLSSSSASTHTPNGVLSFSFYLFLFNRPRRVNCLMNPR